MSTDSHIHVKLWRKFNKEVIFSQIFLYSPMSGFLLFLPALLFSSTSAFHAVKVTTLHLSTTFSILTSAHPANFCPHSSSQSSNITAILSLHLSDSLPPPGCSGRFSGDFPALLYNHRCPDFAYLLFSYDPTLSEDESLIT